MSLEKATASSRRPGRPRKQVDPGSGPRAILAQELQDLLDACGCPTYRRLEKYANVPHRRLAEAARDGQLPSWDVIRGYVQGCWAFSKSKHGHPLKGADNMLRWQKLYVAAGGTLPQESRSRGTCEKPVSPPVPEMAGAPAEGTPAAVRRPRGRFRRALPAATRTRVSAAIVTAAGAALLTVGAIAGVPGHPGPQGPATSGLPASRPLAVPGSGISVTPPTPSCGRFAQDNLRSPATTTFTNLKTVSTVGLDDASAAALQATHDGAAYDWLQAHPTGSRAGIQLRWSDAPHRWHYCTATVVGGNVSALPGQVATVAVPATARGQRVRFQACIWHQHPYTAQCSSLF